MFQLAATTVAFFLVVATSLAEEISLSDNEKTSTRQEKQYGLFPVSYARPSPIWNPFMGRLLMVSDGSWYRPDQAGTEQRTMGTSISANDADPVGNSLPAVAPRTFYWTTSDGRPCTPAAFQPFASLFGIPNTVFATPAPVVVTPATAATTTAAAVTAATTAAAPVTCPATPTCALPPPLNPNPLGACSAASFLPTTALGKATAMVSTATTGTVSFVATPGADGCALLVPAVPPFNRIRIVCTNRGNTGSVAGVSLNGVPVLTNLATNVATPVAASAVAAGAVATNTAYFSDTSASAYVVIGFNKDWVDGNSCTWTQLTA